MYIFLHLISVPHSQILKEIALYGYIKFFIYELKHESFSTYCIFGKAAGTEYINIMPLQLQTDLKFQFACLGLGKHM